LGVTLFGDTYRGRRVLITGHTGFKGSWLALWLQQLGAVVTGVSLPAATTPSHWNLLGLPIIDHRQDIRDAEAVAALIAKSHPEIVFHLAAQSLVRRSYADPLGTWSTNVMGTANVLEAARHAASVRAVVVVTTDKCYENREWVWGYRETDRLGGHDAYSASKTGAELVAASYRRAFFTDSGHALVATVRAGNVIGGGDWSEDRLVPDLMRATAARVPLLIRSPAATRPWQHVLDCLSGYLLLGGELLAGRRELAEAWNVGPRPEDNWSVTSLLRALQQHWPELRWESSSGVHPHETQALYLDTAKARSLLGWRPVWTLPDALKATAVWYRTYMRDGAAASRAQLAEYIDAAASAGARWTR
jgi:CDP-glucose 4,6-dehydratase